MHILRIAARRQMHAHALGLPNRDHRIGDLEHESGAVFNRSAICVGTMIGPVLQELIEQVAIGPVYLHTVKASKFCVLRSFAEGLDDTRNFRRLKCAWRHIIGNWTHHAHMPLGRIALGATGSLPSRNRGSEMRPTCQSCAKIRPPAPCTAFVTNFQASICCGDQIPGTLA